MSGLLRDLRFAARALRRQPLATATALATLGIGIGATVALFGLFDAVALRPLPFADDARLTRLYIEPVGGGQRLSPGVETLLALQRESRSFSHVVGQRYMDLTLHGADGPERVVAIGVTAGWKAALGVEPRHGRAFRPEEEAQGMGSGAALISHAAWQGLLAGRRDVLGTPLRLGDRSYTVVGVMPPGFAFPYDAQFWLPLRPERDAIGPWGFFIPARLAPAVTLATANRELATLAKRLPDMDGRTLTAVPMREVLYGKQQPLSLLLLAAVGFLLLLVCANLANLALARVLARQPELALRASLGAGRRRLLRQLLVEALMLGLSGGALGVGLAAAALPALTALVPDDLLRLGGMPGIDARLALFALALALACSIAFGVGPALRAASQDPAALLRGSAGRGAVTRSQLGRLREGLVGVELALALVLLAGSALLLRDLAARQTLDLGYAADGLLTMTVSFGGAEYGDPQRRENLIDALVSRLGALPGVEAAGATCILPSHRGNFVAPVLIDNVDLPQGRAHLVNHRIVTPGLLPALGVPLLAGRGLGAADSADGEPVALVDASFAHRFWPQGDAVGQRVRQDLPEGEVRWLRVVGVVADVEEFWDLEDTWYLPLAQHRDSPRTTQMVFVTRSHLPPERLAPALREGVWSLDSALPVFYVETPTSIYRQSFAVQRSTTLLAAVFAGFGLLVAAVGVYGAMAGWVGERRRDIAIRLALGAPPRRVLADLTRRGMILLASGLAVGLVAAVALRRALASLVVGLDPAGLLPLALPLATLAVVGAIACLLPARRALRRAPLATLRED